MGGYIEGQMDELTGEFVYDTLEWPPSDAISIKL